VNGLLLQTSSLFDAKRNGGEFHCIHWLCLATIGAMYQVQG